MSAMSDLNERLLAFAQETLFTIATRYSESGDFLIDRITADALARDLFTMHHTEDRPQIVPELDLAFA
jgi:hypothetical protein